MKSEEFFEPHVPHRVRRQCRLLLSAVYSTVCNDLPPPPGMSGGLGDFGLEFPSPWYVIATVEGSHPLPDGRTGPCVLVRVKDNITESRWSGGIVAELEYTEENLKAIASKRLEQALRDKVELEKSLVRVNDLITILRERAERPVGGGPMSVWDHLTSEGS